MSRIISGGAKGHRDVGAAFPEGGAEIANAEAELEFLGRGRKPLTTRLGGYFAILWQWRRG